MAELGKRTYLQYFSSIWGPERLRSYLVEQYAADKLASELADTQYNGFLIASIGKQPAGFLKINWQQHEPMTRRPGAELQKLYVDARFGNRGIGTRLLKSSLILAQEEQEEVLWLQVLTENEAAQRFYRRHGFAPIGEIPFNTDVIQTALIVMVFNLSTVDIPQ